MNPNHQACEKPSYIYEVPAMTDPGPLLRQNPDVGFNWDVQQNYNNPYHQQWMFSAPEVSSEFNLLTDFLGNLYSDDLFDQTQSVYSETPQSLQQNNALGLGNGNNYQQRLAPPTNRAMGNSIARPGSVRPSERARENYYLTAADPSKEAPDERMNQVLKAKLEAGLLKPFNYVKGYKRLSQYMDKNMSPTSRNRILAQIDEFRPKFRERTQALTDLDLVHVEEWFEKSLLEYDRVFASMAVPACLWRRTGEIFRGNKEFAELINVPIEHMRDVIALPRTACTTELTSYTGKAGHIRAGGGGLGRQLLGKVWQDSVRHFTKGDAHELSSQES